MKKFLVFIFAFLMIFAQQAFGETYNITPSNQNTIPVSNECDIPPFSSTVSPYTNQGKCSFQQQPNNMYENQQYTQYSVQQGQYYNNQYLNPQFQKGQPQQPQYSTERPVNGNSNKPLKNMVCRASVRNEGNAQVCGNPENGQVYTYTEYCNASDIGQGWCTKVGDLRYTEEYNYDDTGLMVEFHSRDYRQVQGGNDYRKRNPNGKCTEHYEQIRLPSESLKWEWTHIDDCKVNVPDFNDKNL